MSLEENRERVRLAVAAGVIEEAEVTRRWIEFNRRPEWWGLPLTLENMTTITDAFVKELLP